MVEEEIIIYFLYSKNLTLYLDEYLVVGHPVGLASHIVEDGGELAQELGCNY